jgi:signal transduction histidine kinase
VTLPDDVADILVVDDQPDGLTAIEATLLGLGQRLHRAGSGREALRMLLQRDFAVVLLDVLMPDLDGIEVARLIRERERSSRTPIIFLTAFNEGELPRLQAYAHGAVDYLLKPYEPEVLRSKVSVFVELAKKTALVRRQAEALAQAERKAHEEELVRSREEFLAVALHELRTPLTSLNIQLQAGLRHFGKGPDLVPRHDVHHAYKELEASVQRLSRLGDYLLDVAVIRGGRLELDRKELDLRELTEAVVRRVRDERRDAPVALTVAPEPVTGHWDQRRLELVVGNLLGNALKYGDGAPVDVRVEKGPLGAAMLAVSDRGPGIRPELKERIFEQFVRVGDRPQEGGFGLGLWIVKEIVSRHGGTVGVESAPGEGATFTVTLPPAPAPASLAIAG